MSPVLQSIDPPCCSGSGSSSGEFAPTHVRRLRNHGLTEGCVDGLVESAARSGQADITGAVSRNRRGSDALRLGPVLIGPITQSFFSVLSELSVVEPQDSEREFNHRGRREHSPADGPWALPSLPCSRRSSDGAVRSGVHIPHKTNRDFAGECRRSFSPSTCRAVLDRGSAQESLRRLTCGGYEIMALPRVVWTA